MHVFNGAYEHFSRKWLEYYHSKCHFVVNSSIWVIQSPLTKRNNVVERDDETHIWNDLVYECFFQHMSDCMLRGLAQRLLLCGKRETERGEKDCVSETANKIVEMCVFGNWFEERFEYGFRCVGTSASILTLSSSVEILNILILWINFGDWFCTKKWLHQVLSPAQ